MKIFQNISFSLIGFLYIIIIGGLCYILPIPEMVKAFLALPGFLIIPIFMGKLLNFITAFRKIFSKMDAVSYFTSIWISGIIFILLIAYTMYFLKIFHFVVFVISILILILLSTLFSDDIIKKHFKKLQNVFGSKHVFLLIIGLSLMPAIFILSHMIFPIPINVTNYTHSTSILQIIEEDKLPLINPYSCTSYILFAIEAGIFNTHPLNILWWIPLLMYVLFLCGTALFLYTVSKRRIVAILGAFIGGWILQGGLVGHLYDPTPGGFISTAIFPYILYMLHKNINVFGVSPKKTYIFLLTNLFLFSIYFVVLTILMVEDSTKNFIILVLFFIIFLYIFLIPSFLDNKDSFIFFMLALFMAYPLFTYTVHFPLYFFIIFSYIFFSILIEKGFDKRFVHILFLGMIMFVILFVGLQIYEILSFKKLILNIKLLNLGGSMWDVSFAQKYHNIMSSMSTPLFFIVLLGGLFLFFYLNKRKIVPVMVTYTCIFLYFFPFFITYRILFLMVPFFVYVIADFVTSIYKIATHHMYYYRYSFITYVLVVLIVCSSSFLSISSLSFYALGGSPFKNATISSGTYEEYQAGIWIKHNTPKDTFIISDPATLGIIIGWSNQKMSNDPVITKHGKMPTMPLNTNIDPPLQEYIETLKTVFIEKDSTKTYKKIEKVTNNSNNSLVVISKRTMYWIENNYSDYKCQQSCMWYPYSETNISLHEVSYFKKFFNSSYFELIYNDNDKIYIFRVKKQTEQNESAEY